jgi:hypothetical protein
VDWLLIRPSVYLTLLISLKMISFKFCGKDANTFLICKKKINIFYKKSLIFKFLLAAKTGKSNWKKYFYKKSYNKSKNVTYLCAVEIPCAAARKTHV